MAATNTFKHSGDMGDIIFSVPAINALGGGILQLDPDGGESNPLIKWADKKRTKLNLQSINEMTPLLRMQKGIVDVIPWTGENVNYDLDNFRKNTHFNNLCISHLEAFKLDHALATKPWLNFPTKRKLPKPFVIARSVRYHGNYSFWESQLPQIRDASIFVGFEKDHEIFEYTFGHKIEFYPTPTVLDLAETINSCEIIFCNQGLPHAIAEGLHHDLVCEVYRRHPSAVFQGKTTSQYV